MFMRRRATFTSLAVSVHTAAQAKMASSSTEGSSGTKLSSSPQSSPAAPSAAAATTASRPASPYAVRTTSATLYQNGIHSNLLSEHPLTQKAKRDDLLARQKLLQDEGRRGSQKAAEEAAQLREVLNKTENKADKAYYEFFGFAIVGYGCGHVMAHYLFDGAETRLPYNPAEGFIDSLQEQSTRLESLEALCRTEVCSTVEHPTQSQSSKWTGWLAQPRRASAADSTAATPPARSLVAGRRGGVLADDFSATATASA
jgi:hypothetical protein